jgi:hypothetical protein
MSLEEMQEQMIQLQEQLQTFKAENEALKTKLTEKEQREKELMEHNQKLFLRVTSKKEEETEETKEEIPLCIDEETYKLLSDREKKELNELIEEE